MVDEVAQLLDDLLLGLAVERGDVRKVDRSLAVEGHQQPFLGGGDGGDGRAFAHHVLLHDRRLGGLAGDFVVVLQRHHQHGVRVLAEFHEVGHAADDARRRCFRRRWFC